MKAERTARQERPTSCKRSWRRCCRAQFGLRMQMATQQLTNTSQLKKVRRDIARVRTIMNEKAKRKAAPNERRPRSSRPAQEPAHS